MPTLSAIHVYPVKGCGGVSLPEVELDALGPVDDRRFMLVDDDGLFMSQRTVPRMALIGARLTSSSLSLTAPGMLPLHLSLDAVASAMPEVQVWSATLPALSMGVEATVWLSDFLQTFAELVRFDTRATRFANAEYAPTATPLGFADAYPILLLSQASLGDLNARLPVPLLMDRFRPNLVVTGTAPYEEDSWASIRIGDVVLDIVKPCDRCIATTVDQFTATRGKEPLTTLATYRRRDHKIYLGQNLVHRDLGTLRVGDRVEVLHSQRPMSFDASAD